MESSCQKGEVKMKGIAKRNEGIDLLKALCMVAVVGLHSQRSAVTNTVNNELLYYLSRFAMPCFFMVNGYLILNKQTFTKEYYKKKMFNMLRVLLSGGANAYVHAGIPRRWISQCGIQCVEMRFRVLCHTVLVDIYIRNNIYDIAFCI